MAPAKPVSPLPVKPDPQQPACSKRSQFHPYKRNQIQCYQLAPNKANFIPTIETRSSATSDASFTPTSEARFTATSLLPAKPDCLRGESDHSPTTSFLPVKPEQLLPACSQQIQIVREVRVTMSEQWDKAYERLESVYVRVVWSSRSVVKVSMSKLEWKWVCQSWSGSEYVRVGVEGSMSELLQWACQRCGSVLVGFMRVWVYACQSSKYRSNFWIYGIIHKLWYIIHALLLHYTINSVMLLVNYRCIIMGYQKQLRGVLHGLVLSVLWEVTVGHRAYGRWHVTEYVLPDIAGGFRLAPANIILTKGKDGLHCDTMWYDTEYVACHIGKIAVLWVRFLLLASPVSYVRYPKCTANLHWVREVILRLRIVCLQFFLTSGGTFK